MPTDLWYGWWKKQTYFGVCKWCAETHKPNMKLCAVAKRSTLTHTHPIFLIKPKLFNGNIFNKLLLFRRSFIWDFVFNMLVKHISTQTFRLSLSCVYFVTLNSCHTKYIVWLCTVPVVGWVGLIEPDFFTDSRMVKPYKLQSLAL